MVARGARSADGCGRFDIRAARNLGAPGAGVTTPVVTSAAAVGVMVCHTCGKLARARSDAVAAWCPRCASRLHFRKPQSVSRTWALLAASAILYVPANLLPVMTTSSLFGAQA